MGGKLCAYRLALPVIVSITVLVLSGCPSPLSPDDSAQRNFDLDAPVEPSEGAAPTVDPYDTTPQWGWTPSGGGVDVFRVRLNGGEWTLLPPSVHSGVYLYPNPAVDYYPGIYVFEVQERDGSGNWSETTTQTTTIKVREPSFTAQPSSDIQIQNPAFGWDPYTPAQFGATGRFAFQLERDEAGEWIVIDSESQNDTTAVAYTVSAPLPDGRYRFGVAEWNAGGARSDFTYATFRVDTTPPGVPSVSGASIVSNSNPGLSVFTPVPNSGDTVGEYVWELRDSGAALITSGTTPAGGTVSVALSAGSGGPGVGNYQLLVAQTDLAGNTGTNAAFAVTVEEIPFLGYTGPNPVSSNTPTFDVTGAASLTTFFDWVINGTPQNAPFDSSQPPINAAGPGALFTTITPVLADGTYTISIRQQRPDLSFSTPANAISITVDTVPPPTPTLVSGPADPTNDNTPTVTFTGEAGTDFQWSVSGATVVAPVTVPDGGSDGTETFTL